jgi:hypothetical protein
LNDGYFTKDNGDFNNNDGQVDVNKYGLP